MGKAAAFGMLMWMAGVLIGIGADALDVTFVAGVGISLLGAACYARLIKATDDQRSEAMSEGWSAWRVKRDRIPAETFPPGEFIEDEMKARGWSLDDLHRRLGDDPITCCCVDLCMAVHDKNLIMDEHTAQALGRAFGTSSDYWISLDRAWRGTE